MKKYLITFLFFALSNLVYSQEICNNGIDDDGDGFIDCYDSDCALQSPCDGSFLGNDANCEATPSQFPQFTMTLDFASPDESTNHFSRMAVGDLDRDGMPEIITMNRYTRKLFILNGNDGSVKFQVDAGFEPYWEIATANINNDDCAELFFIGYLDLPGSSDDGVYIFSYDCQLNFLWRTAQKLRGDPINYGLTDFDGDGLVELYAKDEVYDAHTGVRIIQSTAANYSQINGGPVAVDIVGDARQELVLGLSIYQVNLGARTLNSGSLTLLNSRPEYFIRNRYNATSIADFNQDGFLDIIASGSTIGHNTNTTIFYWDVQNNVLNTYIDLTGDYAPNGWQNGTGRINIADLDGDGNLNASYVSGKYLYALDHNLQLLWRIVINEETSGYTGCTLFDFNGDGKSEIVYRDERFLYIIDGTLGTIFSQQACISRTNREYPIVADVDADGSTELCVTCGFNDVDAAANFNTAGYSRYSHVRVFKSASEPWVPARRVWNQHGYFVVNVNDDLTIPRVMQKHHLVFSTGSCTQGPNRPLNKFLNQSPYLNSDGCPTYASPDLAFANTPTANSPTCPDLNYLVSFDITNLGDVQLSGDVPISFYSSNPNYPGAVKFNTITITLNNLLPNDIFSVVDALVTSNGSDSLYVVLNDAGTTIPTPISLPNTNFFECDYDNVIGIRVGPLPVTLTALEVNPDEQCSAPPNGAARAFIPIGGGGENTADYNFYWSDGMVAKPVGSADFVGPFYTDLVAGTYTVYAIHKTANCSSDTVQVVITGASTIIPIVSFINTEQTLCNPPNGRLEVVVDGGNSGYTFEWEGAGASIGITGPILNNQPAGTYRVVITSSEGCVRPFDAPIIADSTADPSAKAIPTSITNCSTLNSGAVTAEALIPGSPQPQPSANYIFDWYFFDNTTSTRGSQLPAIHGAAGTPNRSSLTIGFYEVEVTEIASGCLGTTTEIVEVTDDTILPGVQFTELAPQTSCDPNNPNGILSADALLSGLPQDATEYTFEWFVGQNTLPANLHTDVSGVNGRIAEKLKAGGQAYTVKITNILTQCFVTSFTTVSEIITVPVVTLTKIDNGICVGIPDGTASLSTLSYDGSGVASPFTGYTFNWSTGATTSSISSLAAGFYTLTVTKTDVGCTSQPANIEVISNPFIPPIDLTATNQTSCDNLNPNGILTATVNETTIGGGAAITDGYNFTWENNGNPFATPGAAAGATNAIIDLSGNLFYSVTVQRIATGCTNTESIFLPEVPTNPIVAAVSSNVTRCDVPNGSVLANVGGNQVGFTFFWLNEVGTNQTSDNTIVVGNADAIITDNGSYNGLIPGYYTVVARDDNTLCISQPVTRIVLDNTIQSTITISPGGNLPSSCAEDNGEMFATVAGGVGPFDLFWHFGGPVNSNINFFDNPPQFTPLDNTPFATASIPSGNSPLLTGLESRLYTVIVRDQGNGCGDYESYFLPFINSHTINENIIPATNCSVANGGVEITVTDILAPNDFQDYVYKLYSGENPNPANQIGAFVGPGGAVTNPMVYNPLASGKYTIEVRQDLGTFGSDCPVYKVVEIDQHAFSPLVSLTALQANSSCDVLASDGEVTIQIDVDPNDQTTGFTYDIDVNPAPLGWGGTATIGPYLPPPLPDNFTITGFSPDNVVPQYTITVTSNNCVTQRLVSIPNQPQVSELVSGDLTIANANLCTPSGSIEVNSIDMIGGTGANPDFTNLANYEFTWHNNVALAPAAGIFQAQGGAPLPGELLNITSFPAIGAGSYWIVARKNLGTRGIGCVSAPFKADILDTSEDPDITFTSIVPNSSCDPVNPNGAVIALASERDATTDVYTFTWLYNSGAFPGGTLQTDSTSQLTSAAEGNYAATVTNTLTGCTFTSGIDLILNQVISLPNIVDVVPTNPVNCFPNGSAQVVEITIGGTTTFTNPPDDLDTNFDYEWYKGTTLPSGLIVGQQNSTLPAQLPGTYYVLVQDISTLCRSTFIEVVIDSADIIYPNINIRQVSPQVICDVAALGGSGSLAATVDLAKPLNSRNNLGNYDIRWFPNLDALGGPINAVSDTIVTNRLSGDYSVSVLDISTNCRAQALFILTEDSTKYKPRLALAGNPLTECDSVNSFIFAQALPFPVEFNYPFANNYSADLYNGQSPNLVNPPDLIMPPDPGFPESFIQPNMPVGIYTVRLNDNRTGCSVVDTVSIKDRRIFPIPDIMSINPVSNCDPGNPNGVARVSVNGGIVGFRFDWYEGGAVAGIPVYSGVEYGQLKPILYTVEAFNYVTGCAGTAQTTIQTGQVPIPNPTIVIESHVTSCLVDNGALSASVGGNTKDYVFDWYDGTQEVPPPDFIGEYYIDLSVGPYSVTATSKISGCKSPLATETILDQKVTPEFDFVIANASCDLNNGFATLFMTSPVETSRIEWRDSNGAIITVGPNLLEAFAGTYTVTVTTILGCVNTDDVEILADIRPYNGISRTIDGQNDYFHIDCIDNYENNIVKIFNRAGTLVYEAVGYDNSNIFFDGISNKGISPMGTNLPDGTYFFVVDKRDGSKPIAGYLEVVR